MTRGEKVALVLLVICTAGLIYSLATAQGEAISTGINLWNLIGTVIGLGGVTAGVLLAFSKSRDQGIDALVDAIQQRTPPHIDPWVEVAGEGAKLIWDVIADSAVEASAQNPALETNDQMKTAAVDVLVDSSSALGYPASHETADAYVEAAVSRRKRKEHDLALRIQQANPGMMFSEALKHASGSTWETLGAMHSELKTD